jgi:hypothetical protein
MIFRVWFLVVVALVVQEFTSTAVALLAARDAGFNLWLVHAIWLGVTVLEIVIGFVVGTWTQRKFSGSRAARWAESFSVRLHGKIGNHGKNFFLTVLSFLSFAWLAGFVASWIDVPFMNILLFSVLGEAIWYLFEWAVALGLLAISPNIQTALVSVILSGIGVTAVFFFVRKRGDIVR